MRSGPRQVCVLATPGIGTSAVFLIIGGVNPEYPRATRGVERQSGTGVGQPAAQANRAVGPVDRSQVRRGSIAVQIQAAVALNERARIVPVAVQGQRPAIDRLRKARSAA